ncbi:PqqD family protein [Sphingobacterium hotanense]|uniref:PqqD family protein n=1 Tax=Sphingobacterium hotanense TaxID=649196 RepID=UPI0011F0ED99|nr:PqqD family protein [Sphingobacterium hotanense]
MKLREDLKLRNIGGEHIIVDPGQEMVDLSKVFTLNETAVFLWENLESKQFSIDFIIELLLETFDCDAEVARNDAQQFIDDLKKGGLIVE